MSTNDDNVENFTPVKLDLDIIKTNIPGYSSQKLCEMIVCYRYLGFTQQVAIICMEELSRRRAAGDLFNFEDYIEKTLNELPPLEFNLPNLRDVLHKAINIK